MKGLRLDRRSFGILGGTLSAPLMKLGVNGRFFFMTSLCCGGILSTEEWQLQLEQFLFLIALIIFKLSGVAQTLLAFLFSLLSSTARPLQVTLLLFISLAFLNVLSTSLKNDSCLFRLSFSFFDFSSKACLSVNLFSSSLLVARKFLISVCVDILSFSFLVSYS
jgi:hypothetical protein